MKKLRRYTVQANGEVSKPMSLLGAVQELEKLGARERDIDCVADLWMHGEPKHRVYQAKDDAFTVTRVQ